jgi:thiol:disulfide interchange protein DsbD
MRSILLFLCLLLSPLVQASNFLDSLPGLGGSKKPTFLPPDQVFQVQVVAQDAHTLQANFNIAPGYYLYRDRINFKVIDETAKLAAAVFPEGDLKDDPNFGRIVVFHHSFQAAVPVQLNKPAEKISVVVEYQGCSEQGLCYPPIEKNFEVVIQERSATNVQPWAGKIDPVATTATTAAPHAVTQNEGSKIERLLQQGSFWLVISFFFGAGLLLAFTPCIFPMIPILSGIIVGRGSRITKMHAFILSLAYVIGMAVTYALAGVAAGFSGELISNALQTPWVLGSFAAVFVLLSLSMFGFYELQLPTALQSKLADTSNRLHGGHLGGVFIMGALSAVIMGPCVAAPLAGALLYISKTHDAVLGGMALFTLAMGMGAPLLLIGTSAGALLPKAGAWMDAVKRGFGVMLLALAIWIIQPLLSITVQMALWALLLILTAAYLHVLDALPQRASGWIKLRKGVGLLLLLLGISYLVGALSGAHDILRPLGALGKAENTVATPFPWQRVKDMAELDSRIAQAKGKVVVLDFYADWCVSCKEMERYTFGDAEVRRKMQAAVLLQLDVTANTVHDKAVLKRYGLFGPPATLFFDTRGQEMEDARVVGYQEVVEFQKSLKSAGL